MPMHPVTSTLMYRGICTIPDILSYSAPVNLPEDEVEGEMAPVGVYPRVLRAGEGGGVWGCSFTAAHVVRVCVAVVSSCGGAPSNRRAVSTLDSAQGFQIIDFQLKKQACFKGLGFI